MKIQYCVVYCTCPNASIAEEIAEHVLQQRLVACVNIIPNLSSHYIWNSDLKKGEEVLLMMKTKQKVLVALEQSVLKRHPYEFPEFIAMPIIYGNQDYLNWIEKEVIDVT